MSCSGLETYKLTSLDLNLSVDVGCLFCSFWHGNYGTVALTDLLYLKYAGPMAETSCQTQTSQVYLCNTQVPKSDYLQAHTSGNPCPGFGVGLPLLYQTFRRGPEGSQSNR